MGPNQGGLLPMFGLGTPTRGPKNGLPRSMQHKPFVVSPGLNVAAGFG